MYDLARKLGFDLSEYEGYEYKQLKEILHGMISQVDYKIYAKPDVPYYQMNAVRKCLELDLQVTADDNWISLRNLYISRSANYTKYREKLLWEKNGITFNFNYVHYSIWQLRCIWFCKKLGITYVPLLDVKLGSERAVMLFLDLLDNLYQPGINYSRYSVEQLKIIRKLLRDNKDAAFICDPHITPSKMDVLVAGKESGYDLTPYVMEYDSCQLDQILRGFKLGIPFELFGKPNYDARKMQYIINEVVSGNDVTWVDDSTYWFNIGSNKQ